MQISDLEPEQADTMQQVAALLVRGFATQAPSAWPTMADARQEVQESFGPDRLSRVARNDRGTALGWIGACQQYDGHVWELHPLVVDPAHRRQGIGRALVTDLEARVRERGGLTLWLGADDESAQTTLGGVDLYPDVCAHLAAIRNLRGHPYTFYQRLGFIIVGVLPDANGFGKPDIFLAKRLVPPPAVQLPDR
ncbi:MAG: GNAT family N-acetyltransferase [Thermomicrobiales bacterium]